MAKNPKGISKAGRPRYYEDDLVSKAAVVEVVEQAPVEAPTPGRETFYRVEKAGTYRGRWGTGFLAKGTIVSSINHDIELCMQLGIVVVPCEPVVEPSETKGAPTMGAAMAHPAGVAMEQTAADIDDLDEGAGLIVPPEPDVVHAAKDDR